MHVSTVSYVSAANSQSGIISRKGNAIVVGSKRKWKIRQINTNAFTDVHPTDHAEVRNL